MPKSVGQSTLPIRSSAPASAVAGQMYFNSTTALAYVCTVAGTPGTWVSTGGSGATYVTSLPGSPADGQEVYYAADAANGVIWHLRYRSAATGSYKWDCVGGSKLAAEIATSVGGTASTSFANMGMPSITVPLAGDYDIVVFTEQAWYNNTGTYAYGMLGFATGGTSPTDNECAAFYTNLSQVIPMSLRRRKTSLAASTVLQMQAKVTNASTGTYYPNNGTTVPLGIHATPVRVG